MDLIIYSNHNLSRLFFEFALFFGMCAFGKRHGNTIQNLLNSQITRDSSSCALFKQRACLRHTAWPPLVINSQFRFSVCLFIDFKINLNRHRRARRTKWASVNEAIQTKKRNQLITFSIILIYNNSKPLINLIKRRKYAFQI